jgi:hypothetical protein
MKKKMKSEQAVLPNPCLEEEEEERKKNVIFILFPSCTNEGRGYLCNETENLYQKYIYNHQCLLFLNFGILQSWPPPSHVNSLESSI